MSSWEDLETEEDVSEYLKNFKRETLRKLQDKLREMEDFKSEEVGIQNDYTLQIRKTLRRINKNEKNTLQTLEDVSAFVKSQINNKQ